MESIEKLIKGITEGCQEFDGEKRAWVGSSQEEDFERICKERGIEVVKTRLWTSSKGDSARWYYPASKTITYYRKGAERIEVPIKDAVDPRRGFKFRKRIFIDGKFYAYNIL